MTDSIGMNAKGLYEPEHLERWTTPDSWFGQPWPNHYVFLGQHRDSDALSRSNFTTALDGLGGESETVTVVRESHWAVGWIEWIAIHETDETALREADSMCAALEDYPVLDDEAFSNLEWEEAQESWEWLSMRDRIELCAKEGVSIFAARSDCIPQDDSGAIFDYLRTP